MDEQNTRNLIGGQHALDKKNWLLTLVRNPKTDHGFLVIEGIDEFGQRVAIEAHLGHKKVSDVEYDNTKCGIYLMPASIEKLQKVHESFQYKSWPITSDEAKNILLKKINEDQAITNSEKGMNYIKFTTTEKGWGGFIGDTLDTFALSGLKDASIKTVHASSEGGSTSTQISHDSLIASLDNSENKNNCTSWAIKTALTIPSVKENFNEGIWAKYIVIIPSQVMNTSPKTTCLVM